MILSRREKRRWKNKYWIAACVEESGQEAAEATGGWTGRREGNWRKRYDSRRLLARGFAVNSERKVHSHFFRTLLSSRCTTRKIGCSFSLVHVGARNLHYLSAVRHTSSMSQYSVLHEKELTEATLGHSGSDLE